MNDEKLRELISDIDAAETPVTQPSMREWRLFREALAAESPQIQCVEESIMRLIVLKLLHQGRADGGEMVEKLDNLRVRLFAEGEGPIFALLANMESQELIIGEFDVTMKKKTYSVTSRGSSVLEQKGESVRSINPEVAELWAV